MKYCTGCGIDIKQIRLDVRPVIGFNKSEDNKGHSFYWDNPNGNESDYTFYECSEPLTFCEKCGQPLKDEDIKTFEQKHNEGRAEILVSGYKCSSCGFDVDY